MKYLVITLILFSLFSINEAIAQQVKDCTFGGTMTPLSEKFAKDLAVKEFVSQNPDVTRSIVPDEHDSSRNLLVLYAENNEINETLELQFDTDEKGCYIPVLYHYTYDNGIIAFTVTNTIGNFTEIMNLIKSDDITIDDLYPDNCKFLTLEHSISNGKVYGICKEKNSVTALVDAYSNGTFEVTIPIKTLYSLPSTNCIPTGDFFVIDDTGESNYDISQSDSENHVKIELDEGFHRIQILGSVILPSPSPAQYCGIVEGYDKPYLPPSHQIKHEMSPTSIKCNEGLVLILKYDGTPACVKTETKAKLIERGWIDNITKHDVYFLNVNGGYDIPYSISGSILSSITANIDESKLVIKLNNSTNDGNLIITLPRTVIDRKIGNDDGDFVVMINNMTINFKETRDDLFRILEIPFVKGTETIDILSPHDVT